MGGGEALSAEPAAWDGWGWGSMTGRPRKTLLQHPGRSLFTVVEIDGVYLDLICIQWGTKF